MTFLAFLEIVNETVLYTVPQEKFILSFGGE